jgi:hypothetical protein
MRNKSNHFDTIFKDHLKNEYDDYEIIFYKFNYNIDTFKSFKIPKIDNIKPCIIYILFDNCDLYFQKLIDNKVTKTKLEEIYYLIFE